MGTGRRTSRPRSGARAPFEIELGLDEAALENLQAAFSRISARELRFLQDALASAGETLEGNIRTRAPFPAIAAGVRRGRVSATSNGISYWGKIAHPAARSAEFGRVLYWRGYKRGKVKRGRGSKGVPFASSPGFVARPYVGIIRNDHAIGATKPELLRQISRAIDLEFLRGASR